ncbi:ammonium transporter Rh [Mytilus galloprovincialis]|uniref:Ammonium transporter Rh n=1 Tax=Mytilus galloprovincialis TaxID=29158 RepID=A0A8B6EZ71_MYTGA|nr:ammonium transporter Rh [Mytilus galloprovincialis]
MELLSLDTNFPGVLKKSLNVLGLSQGKYSSHSFRIGAATSAAMNGLSDSEIQAMGSPITIWIVGSSLVKNAFVQARRRPGGINLGLDHIGVRLWWLGKSGMRLKDLLNRIKLMLRYEEPPNYLVIHIGGNDLGEIKTGVLRNRLKHYVNNIKELLLNTTLVWSQILPRLTWRYSANIDAMDRSRQRINSSLASYIIRHGGHYIRYPDISPNSTFICQDGVHLTDIACQVIFVIIFGLLAEYEEPAQAKSRSGKTPVTAMYPMFQDVHVMIFIGFGFLMTFLKRYGYSAIGINLLLASFVIQWALIVRGFIHGNVLQGGKFSTGLSELSLAHIRSVGLLCFYYKKLVNLKTVLSIRKGNERSVISSCKALVLPRTAPKDIRTVAAAKSAVSIL